MIKIYISITLEYTELIVGQISIKNLAKTIFKKFQNHLTVHKLFPTQV